MNANETQIGGAHYKTEFEHWDFVSLNGNRYLEGAASKYLTRWRGKNGVQDLKKAVHFIDKLIEEAKAGRIEPISSNELFSDSDKPKELKAFIAANSIPELEASAIECLFSWRCVEHLTLARSFAQSVLRKAEEELANGTK